MTPNDANTNMKLDCEQCVRVFKNLEKFVKTLFVRTDHDSKIILRAHKKFTDSFDPELPVEITKVADDLSVKIVELISDVVDDCNRAERIARRKERGRDEWFRLGFETSAFVLTWIVIGVGLTTSISWERLLICAVTALSMNLAFLFFHVKEYRCALKTVSLLSAGKNLARKRDNDMAE